MIDPKRIIVGTRSSHLSLVQTQEILQPLRQLFPDIEFIVNHITTSGDKHKSTSILDLPRGMFAKELESALINGDIDMAIHSAKDLTTTIPDELVLAAVSERKDPRDVLINKWGVSLLKLPENSRIGTGSPRRIAQIKAVRPDLAIIPIRGNIETRLTKGRSEEYDGIVIAAAGMLRLELQEEISEYLKYEVCTPAVGQGALAIQTHKNNRELLKILSYINHENTNLALKAERTFLRSIGGECSNPVTAYAWIEDTIIHMTAMASTIDGNQLIRIQVSGGTKYPKSVAYDAVTSLKLAGAEEIITGHD